MTSAAMRLTRPLRLWIIALPHDTPQGRVKKVGGRFLLILSLVGAFMLGSAGTFLMFDWPPLLRDSNPRYSTSNRSFKLTSSIAN